MKLAYLSEVAALISAHSYMLLESPDPLSNAVLGDFYIHSRNRLNRWQRDLNDIENGVQIRDPLHLIGLDPVRPPIQSITEQILTNDLLNRVWTVAVIANDRHRQEDRGETLAKNVLQGHLMVRHKALGLCLDGFGMTPEQVIHVNQVRGSAERWSDLLCCQLMERFDLWGYAYDADRAREFCEERFGSGDMKPRNPAWTLILAGLRYSFPDTESLGAPLHEDDRLITRAILNAFPKGAGNMAIWSGTTLARVPR